MKLPPALTQPSEMARMVVSYTALRVALFAVVFLLLLFSGLQTIIDLGIALVVSALLSYPMGRHQRDRMVVLMEQRKASKGR